MPICRNNRFCAGIFKAFALVAIVLASCFGVDVCAQKPGNQNPGNIYQEAGRLCAQGGGLFSNGSFKDGIPFFLKAIQLYKSVGDTAQVVTCYQSVGSGYQMTNNSDSSLYYYNRALDLSIRIKDTASISNCYMWLGSEAYNRSFAGLAVEYLRKSAHIDSLRGDYGHLSQSLCRLGFVYIDIVDSSRSLNVLQTTRRLFEDAERLQTANNYSLVSGIDANVGLAMLYAVMANFYDEPIYADSSLHYYKASLATRGFGNYSHSLASQAYVKCLIYKKDYRTALDFMQKEELFFSQSKIHAQSYHVVLSELYEKIGDYREALNHSRIVNTLQKEINSEGNTRAVAKAEAEKATAAEREKLERVEMQRKQLRTFVAALVLGLCLGAVLLVFLFMMARTRRNTNKALSEKNAQLNSQKDEIAAQKDIIVSQMRQVESVNEKLFSSIDYARRIQRATVSSASDIKALFGDSFLYFCPCDMVSGDFYWAVRCGRFSVMAIADCTGHGIPGAFLSMLGISALKEYCTKEIDAENPGTVLDNMRIFIKTTLNARDGKIIDDGMDMTICCFDMENMELRYATANQVAYIVRRDELIKLKGDSMPIGHYVREKEHFATLSVKLVKGDMVYMFTDGIQDQMGGQYKKRFLRSRLLRLLTEISDKPCDQQSDALESTILEWQGENPQIDDMTMVGIRV